MADEIERKFLVAGDFRADIVETLEISQGYLNSDPNRTVRVRMCGKDAFITIKGPGSESGMSRYEFEMAIDPKEAAELIKLCEPGWIEKTRFIVPFGNHRYEVDVFKGKNLGLVVAEIELASEDEVFERPDWLGKEVTGLNDYYNSALAKRPFSEW